MDQLITTLRTIFKIKAPSIPDDIVELIVTYGPYLLIISLIMQGLALLTSFGIWNNPMYMYYYGPRLNGVYSMHFILTIVSFVFLLIAVRPLLNREMIGWRYLFYLSLVQSVLLLMQSVTLVSLLNIPGVLVSFLLAMYILFQIEHKYK